VTEQTKATAEVRPPAVPTPEVTPEPAAPPSPVGTSGRAELPRTASNMPLVGLIGLLSLIAAVSVRTLARTRA
jgi:hypothetical protein